MHTIDTPFAGFFHVFGPDSKEFALRQNLVEVIDVLAVSLPCSIHIHSNYIF